MSGYRLVKIVFYFRFHNSNLLFTPGQVHCSCCVTFVNNSQLYIFCFNKPRGRCCSMCLISSFPSCHRCDTGYGVGSNPTIGQIFFFVPVLQFLALFYFFTTIFSDSKCLLFTKRLKNVSYCEKQIIFL
jgi:hypothetical protein